MKVRNCYKCKKTKPEDNFRFTSFGNDSHGNKKIYRRTICIDCQLLLDKSRMEYRKLYSKKYLSNPANVLKIEARRKFVKAIKQGLVIRQNFCEACGSNQNIEAHHPDYNKPLYVQWLCKKHHYQADKKILPCLHLIS